MAKISQAIVRTRLAELPRIELVPVDEDKVRASERRVEVHHLIARMYLLSRKRGRPSLSQDEENYAA